MRPPRRYHNDETSEFTEVLWETVRKASIYRSDLTCMKAFRQEFDDTHGYTYHRKCYINYINIKSVGNLGSEGKQPNTIQMYIINLWMGNLYSTQARKIQYDCL